MATSVVTFDFTIWTQSAPAFAALNPSLGQVYFNIATASISANDQTNPAFVDGNLPRDVRCRAAERPT
jgi:hypothetical protein